MTRWPKGPRFLVGALSFRGTFHSRQARKGNWALRDREPHTMKMLAEYLEKAITFEKMAGEQKDAKLKANIEYLALAYRKLADERATKLGLLKPQL